MTVPNPEKKKRGRPRLNKEKTNNTTTKPITNNKKRRGRKPKGGKIITDENKIITNNTNNIVNIVTHLKCRESDLLNSSHNSITFFDINQETNASVYNSTNTEVISDNITIIQSEFYENISTPNNSTDIKSNILPVACENKHEILNSKINHLLENNENNFNKSDCFWCTCSFDNQCIYIPKYILNNQYYVYGCFCSPECATSFLFNENINDFVKYERYQLLNSLYVNSNPIKPAANPFYTLDKYLGNLSISEYRSIFDTNRLLLVIDKPITRDIPYIHENSFPNDYSTPIFC